MSASSNRLLCLLCWLSVVPTDATNSTTTNPWYTTDNVIYWWIIAVICVVVFALWLIMMCTFWVRRRIVAARYRAPKRRPRREVGRETVVVVDRNPLPQRTVVINETNPPARVEYRSQPKPSRLAGTSGMSRKEYFARPS